jgi:hypothetical protein
MEIYRMKKGPPQANKTGLRPNSAIYSGIIPRFILFNFQKIPSIL